MCAVTSVLAGFSTIPVDDTSLVADEGTPSTFRVLEGGLNTQGQTLRAGGRCEVGEYIRYYECDSEQGESCDDLFSTFWLKTDTNDLLFYRDEQATREKSFWATYVCYAAQPTSSDEQPQKKTPTTDCSIHVKEGETVQLRFIAEDPDGDELQTTFDFGSLNSQFDKRNDVYVWETQAGDEGIYAFEATTTDGELSSSTSDCIEVLSVNNKPNLVVRDVTVEEGETVEADVSCVDPDGDTVSIEFEGKMSSATWKTTYTDAGTYTIEVTCSDEQGSSVSKSFTVTVQNKNRAPTISWQLAS